MSVLPQLRESLVRAAERAAASGAPGRSRASWRSAVRAVPTLMAVGVALVVGFIAIVSLHHGAAPKHARVASNSRTDAVVSGGQQLIDILGVLRRPQTKADLNPELVRRITSHRPGLVLAGAPVLSLLRLATVTSWGDKVFVVPFKPPTRSSVAELPPELRRIAARLLAHEGHAEGLGLFLSDGGTCCATARAIEAGDDWISGGPDPNTLVLVVPDGVASVTIVFSPGPASKRRRAETTVVHDNVAAFLPPYAVEDLSIGKMIWHTRDGRVIKLPAPGSRHRGGQR